MRHHRIDEIVLHETELYRELTNQKIELERLNSRLFRQARIDGLTQVGNRLKMREDLDILFAGVVEQRGSFLRGHVRCRLFQAL
jgi:GGDEF domain-containing protein